MKAVASNGTGKKSITKIEGREDYAYKSIGSTEK